MMIVKTRKNRSKLRKLADEVEVLKAKLENAELRIQKKDEFVEQLLYKYEQLRARSIGDAGEYCDICGRKLRRGEECSCLWDD